MEEMPVVLSRYDLGKVSSVRELPRGSHAAAKVFIETDRGKYLLKRRPRGKADPQRVAFSHALQQHLAEQHFPLPHLVRTREDNASVLHIGDATYEVFEFIEGEPYDGSLDATHDVGKTLGVYHRIVHGFDAPSEPPGGSFHDASGIHESFARLFQVLAPGPTAKDRQDDLRKILAALKRDYQRAADEANALGLPEWETQIIHSDWHPGNMIFKDQKVVAVIDFEAARVQPRVIDVANGSLQFSMLTGSRDLATWPEQADTDRVCRLLQGYDETNQLSEAELKAIVPLMREALIAQSIPPILKTGTFAGLDGFHFLLVVLKKERWLAHHADRIHLEPAEH